MIKIRQLEDEHRSRVLQIKKGNLEILGPTRCLNKREIKKFREPNYIPGQENWLGIGRELFNKNRLTTLV